MLLPNVVTFVAVGDYLAVSRLHLLIGIGILPFVLGRDPCSLLPGCLPLLADRIVSVAGASPDKQLLSHPLALDSPASDDPHSAGCLTSAEPSWASSFTSQAPAQVLSVALGNLGDATAPKIVPRIVSRAPRDAAAPDAVLNDASFTPEKLENPDIAAQSTATANQQQQQQQQQQTLTQLSPLLLSEQCKSEAGISSLHSPTLQLPIEAAASSPTVHLPEEAAAHSPAEQLPQEAELADPLHGDSPAQDEYDPERYKPYALPTEADLSFTSQPVHQAGAQTQPLDAQPLNTQPGEYAQAFSKEEIHDAPTLSAQSQVQAETGSQSQDQTQLVGQSPKQAALHRLRSIIVKQSQTIKAEGAPQPLPERQTGHDAEGQRAKAAFGLLSERQMGHDAEVQGAKADFGLLSKRPTGHEAEETVSTDPAAGKAIKATPLLLSPRRSSSVAKLRSQSLAKQLQDPRYASMRRLPLVPIPGTGIDGSQQSAAGEAGCRVTPEKDQDGRGGFMPGSSTANQFAEELDKTSHQAIAEEAGQASRAFRSHRPTVQSAAAANLAADRAGTGQPCPTHEGAAVHLADIHVVLDTPFDMQSSALASMLPREPQDDPSLGPPEPPQLLAPSTDTLNPQLCSHTGAGAEPELAHQLRRSSSKSEGASPAKPSRNPDSSPVLDQHPHLCQDSLSSACLHPVDGSSMRENGIRQAVNDSCAVAVCIRSSGIGATLSLEVQELSSQDSRAETAAAMTHPIVSIACEFEEDAMVECKGPDNAPPSIPSQLCQAAAAPAEDCLREEEGRNRQQAAAALTEGRANSAETPEASQVSEHEHRDVSSSPGGNAHRAVSSSPGRRGSPGQGFLGRLEGGLRSWLGRGSKQTVGQCRYCLFVKC